MLIGAIIVKIAASKTGREWRKTNRLHIAVGLLIDNGLTVTISIALTTILNSLWFMPM